MKAHKHGNRCLACLKTRLDHVGALGRVLLGRTGVEALLRCAVVRALAGLEVVVASDPVFVAVHAELNQLSEHLAEVLKEKFLVLGVLKR